ncbi:MAG: HAD-IIB family hydrolase [Gammaproteobacteria bacterium]|nr:HAD-IIB family hydrolase [Gammaproteobacteria bacterium]
MSPVAQLPLSDRRRICAVLTDIDDTLTDGGQLHPLAFQALHQLSDAGVIVIPVTGRPAGWCDLIARMWPVSAVVGENGAFYFSYDRARHRMLRHYQLDSETRRHYHARLMALKERIITAVPGAAISADQAYRESDLAIDYCEDVPPLSTESVATIARLFEESGATAKISSIHVNGWFGAYDKLTTSKALLRERFGLELDDDEVRKRVAFVGDSPNDEPMFAYLPNAVGVANVRDFAGSMEALPRWVTDQRGGAGFAEFARLLLESRGA